MAMLRTGSALRQSIRAGRLPLLGCRSFSSEGDGEAWHLYQRWQLGFQKIDVPEYGRTMALNQIATVESGLDDDSFYVVPWDPPSTAAAIRRQIEKQTDLYLQVDPDSDDHKILLVADLEAEETAKMQTQLKERLENRFDIKAKERREKKTERQWARLQVYEMLDSFAWSELPESAKQMYEELGWHEGNWDSNSAPSEELAWDLLTARQQETATKLGYEKDTWDEWNDLSPEQQKLWNVLGWSEKNWNGGEEAVAVEALNWSDLSQEQRDAAVELGFQQDTWDEWDDLPAEKQELWGKLGWTAENWSSNVGGVETENIEWDALSAEQQAAAEALGFAQDTWDEWNDLSPEQQKLWNVLGWSEKNWNGGEEAVAVEALNWSDLSQEQRDAAVELGFQQDTWDEWDDLPAEKQELWGKLGWTAENWASGEGIETEDLSWDALSAEQQAAAEALGFPQDAWDNNWAEW